MIQLFRLFKKFGDHTALHDVSMHVAKGEFVFITGPSGAGKTTLLRLIHGSEKPSSGNILVDSINLSRISRVRLDLLRQKIGYVFQDFKLLPNRTVSENVSIALEIMGAPDSVIQSKTRQVLEFVGLKKKAHLLPLVLSGGEQQRVAIARAMVKDPLILLADEPTGNLDSDLTTRIMEMFKEIHQRGATVVVATHSRELLENNDFRTIVLNQGII
ncbi:MAG TPA: cell division ATP-binding protein FtsE [Deltaproteobacteria bacterium]|nr:cell division ATP-binding protein FtsE [Deltaproteobacteria bacterium]HIJ35911.1 cell division ATP-binding protein FtsE [Deltaproteobacteria bacterium]HIJ40145.1 cell division ATP-binding protein FtsE [Deltaproteobacteria bacterium]HIJ40714.1 cell division ATP-binding protein FtsE [Deltaproteobacteria bacterium]